MPLKFENIFKSQIMFAIKMFSYKKQIEDAEEIAALNLAKYRKAQQQLEEAEERSQAAESNMVRMRAGTPGADRIAEIRDAHGRFMSPFFVSKNK